MLQVAEAIDNYQTLCARSKSNREARQFNFYREWEDQTEARKIEQMYGIPGDVKVIIMHPTADNGMPHTRADKFICLPAYSSETNLTETIRHELVHIEQKRNPEKWRNFLLKEGWSEAGHGSEAEKGSKIGEQDLPDYVKGRIRLNPDTLGPKYMWEGRYLPCPIFEREDKPRLQEIEVRWWDIKTEQLLPFTPTSFTRKYGQNMTNAQKEHPYELYAYGMK
jgi:hypothetical protein